MLYCRLAILITLSSSVYMIHSLYNGLWARLQLKSKYVCEWIAILLSSVILQLSGVSSPLLCFTSTALLSPRPGFFSSAALLHLVCASSSRPVLFIAHRRLLSSLTAEGRPVVSRGSRSWFWFFASCVSSPRSLQSFSPPSVDRSPDKRSPTHLSVIHNSLDLSWQFSGYENDTILWWYNYSAYDPNRLLQCGHRHCSLVFRGIDTLFTFRRLYGCGKTNSLLAILGEPTASWAARL